MAHAVIPALVSDEFVRNCVLPMVDEKTIALIDPQKGEREAQAWENTWIRR